MGIVIVSTIGCGKRYLKNIVRDKIKTEDFNVDEGMTVDDAIELIDENDVTFVPYSKDNINFLEENSIDYDLFYPSKSRRIEFLTNAVGKRMKAKDVSDLDKSFNSTVDEIESLELDHGYLHKLDNQGEFLGNYPQLIGYISNIKS